MKRLFTIFTISFLTICAQAQMLVPTQFDISQLPFALTNLGTVSSTAITNSGNIQTATLNVTGTANVTSMTVTQVVNSISLFSGPTNNYDLSKSLQHYITSTAMAITGFVGSGSSPGLQPNSQLVVSNSSGSSVVLTFTSAITTPDGARAYTITNGTMRRFAFGTSTNTAGSMIAYTNVNPLNTYY